MMKLYLLTFVIFFAVDFVWLGFVAPSVYDHYIGFLLAEDVNFWAAGIFYILYIFGLVYFVIQPAINKGSVKRALVTGAFFGFITYATYDLTNLATIEGWPVAVTIIDLIWGSLLNGVTSAIVTWIYLRKK
ncbi:DUF2177 family protein [Paenisporosarcina cavernae]|uniref:DUF2177 family protein n=2 Tax=Paenisporosarcina cavernae TaxID=2320858 RepID=A0A385YY38_9BACL|nr:DUF2177 family protein [Paenisporosarcina cavernae]